MIVLLKENKDIITAVTAILAILFSAASLIFARGAMSLQRLHNRKSLVPISYLSIGDYEDNLFVRLNNDGVGPMIIDEIGVLNIDTKEQISSAIIDVMPGGLSWETFVRDIRGRALSPGKDILLISLSGSATDAQFMKDRDAVRHELARLSIRVKYHSVYEEKFSTERSLDWFGRTKDSRIHRAG